MLTLSVSGRDKTEAINILREAANTQETELKVLIDNPQQASDLQKFLESEGFSKIIPEDDDGTLYLTATKASPDTAKPKPAVNSDAGVRASVKTELQGWGVVISGEARKYEREFMEKVIASLLETEAKPDMLSLMNGAIKLAAYDTPSCDILKKLEAAGVRVLISKTCSDRLGITEALGAGMLVSLSEILEAVSKCEKLLSL